MPPLPRFSLFSAVALIALAAAGEARADTPSRTNFSNQWQTQGSGDQKKPAQRQPQAGQPVQGTWFG